MDEVNDLVTKICSPSIALDDRKHAEDRLLQLLSDLNTWKYYCSQLSQADDTNIFFISVGLQRLIWKNYRVINNEDKLYLIQTILQVLVHNYSHSDSNNDCNSVSNCNSGGNSNKLQAFTQSKLEQLLVTVCCTSVTIEPITSLLVEPSSPTAIVGVCCIRTLLELVLSDEPKLLYEQKEELTLLIKNILVPLINLIGNNCSYILNNYTNNNHTISNSDSHGDSNDMKERFLLMIRSLEALQLIIVKLPIGNHITSDVIQLLFTISELACNSDSHSNSSEVYEQVSLLSIDILTEIMGKRYLPFNDNSNGDNGMKILLEIMVKVISLLKNYRYSIYYYNCYSKCISLCAWQSD